MPGPGDELLRSRGPAARPVRKWGFPEDPQSPKEKTEALTCWLPQVPAWFPRLRQLFELWERGTMLVGGGALGQPSWYLQAMQYFGACRDEFLATRMKSEAEAARLKAEAEARARSSGKR